MPARLPATEAPKTKTRSTASQVKSSQVNFRSPHAPHSGVCVRFPSALGKQGICQGDVKGVLAFISKHVSIYYTTGLILTSHLYGRHIYLQAPRMTLL